MSSYVSSSSDGKYVSKNDGTPDAILTKDSSYVSSSFGGKYVSKNDGTPDAILTKDGDIFTTNDTPPAHVTTLVGKDIMETKDYPPPHVTTLVGKDIIETNDNPPPHVTTLVGKDIMETKDYPPPHTSSKKNGPIFDTDEDEKGDYRLSNSGEYTKSTDGDADAEGGKGTKLFVSEDKGESYVKASGSGKYVTSV